MAEQLSDPKWTCFPKMLNEKHVKVPYVIGPFLDTTGHDDRDGKYFSGKVASAMWVGDPETSTSQQLLLQNRILPCSLDVGFSAKYLLDELSMGPTEVKPSLHTAWADIHDPAFWVGTLAHADCDFCQF